MIDIRIATADDQEAIWRIIHPVISAGDTLAFSPASSRDEMLAYWLAPDKHTYVATLAGKVVGTFMIKDNQPGLGSHIANAGYLTAPEARGKGVGKAMCEYSLAAAKRLGYRAMQFNIVVKSNEGAVRLWQNLGFKIIGEIPEAFNHRQHGLTNAYIMYRKL